MVSEMKIAIIPNIKKDIGLVVTTELLRHLQGRAEVYMESAFSMSGLQAEYTDDIYSHADMVIVLGGDGTILQVAEPCARRGIPILGINLGRIGFMSEIEREEMDMAVNRILSGDYRLQKRMMMKIQIYHAGKLQGTYHALNDAVIAKSAETRLMGMELFSSDEKISEYAADGLIISTPTGSTGYNLSAGGPVVNPMMELFIAAPICAHMLTARPAVLPADDKIRVRLTDRFSVNEAAVSVDGDICGYIKGGDEIVITKSGYETKLVKISEKSFYDVLINKLT